jgi:hypothetical protein
MVDTPTTPVTGQFQNPANGQGGGNAGDVTPPAWHASVDAETRGHWQSQQWDMSDPVRLAAAATKAHREAVQAAGGPIDRLLRLPEPTDTAAMRGVWERLGAPKEAAGYEFTGIKFSDGSDLGPEFETSMKASFHQAGVPKEAAAALTRDFVKFMEQSEAAEKAELQTKLQAQTAELQRNWGPNFEANRFIAKQAAKALGVDEGMLDTLETQLGYSKVMEMFRSIGTKIGEDKFVASGGGGSGNGGVMTRDQAAARIADLRKDTAWVKAYLNGGSKEKSEMHALQVMIHGDDTNSSRGF